MYIQQQSAGGHTFVVPAYGRSPFLRDALASLVAQTSTSRILVTSSTAYDGLEALVADFGAKLVVHHPNRGIGHDWNFALAQAKTRWVTLAHQDDTYEASFVERTLEGFRRHPNAILVFTNYSELVDGVPHLDRRLLKIKRLLLEMAFLGRSEARSEWAKTNAVRFGCSIPCPTVTLDRERANVRFSEELRVNLDWAAWLDLCKAEGSFVWIRQPLMNHRIHAGSETSNTLGSGHRSREDAIMLERLWPRPFARAIAKAYSIAYASNQT